MPSKIRVLDDHTINKIAAGEVIESPASVVKELVENSIDAGSTDICVEIQGGGRQLIRVTDNGCGMSRDDALLCLERHATSKIKEVEDIQTTFTMGFRGEAIPSIASISKFSLITAPQEDAHQATLLRVEGGKVLQCVDAVRTPGTTIEIKSLFFNVPVRRKFQKSPSHDAQEIHKVLTILALGHPHIKFQLIDDKKTSIQTGSVDQGNFLDQMKQRVNKLMGAEFLSGCSLIDIEMEGCKLQGCIGMPILARLNRTGQYLFINHRAVFSPLVSYVVKQSYGTTLPSNKHPVFIFHLSVPGEIVDVNVHPQKKEVRLRQESVLKEMIHKGVQQALNQQLVEGHEVYRPLPDRGNEEFLIPAQAFNSPLIKPAFSLEASIVREKIKEYTPLPSYSNSVSKEASLIQPIPHEMRLFPRILHTIPNYIILDASSLDEWKKIPYDSLCLVDQRAAHSRVIFESLCANDQGKISQSLLIPHTIQLAHHEAVLLRSLLDQFLTLGIHIHESGPQTFMVDTIPQVFGNIDITKLVVELIGTIHEFSEEQLLEKEIEKKMALLASRAAVNSNKRLSLEEATSLIHRLFKCQTPFVCPRGKPTLIYFEAEELMKKFHKGI